MEPDSEIKLAAFAKRAGQWGLQLFGDELEKANGDIEVALEKARERFNRNPSPPPSAFLEALAIANRVTTAKEEGIELPSEQQQSGIPKQQEQPNKFGWKPKHSRVKPSPFQR